MEQEDGVSIIIRGMQMPSECGYCPLCRYFYSAGITNCMLMQTPLAEDYKTIRFEGRHKDCPLVELPEKHGRLIDADALKDTLDYYIREAGWSEEINKALGWVKDEFIDSERTIVEAEGK